MRPSSSLRGLPSIRVLLLCIAGHSVLAFLLFSLVFLLPDTSLIARVAGAVFDVLTWPFIGQSRLGLPAAADRFGGIPIWVANSVVWGTAAYAALAAIQSTRRVEGGGNV